MAGTLSAVIIPTKEVVDDSKFFIITLSIARFKDEVTDRFSYSIEDFVSQKRLKRNFCLRFYYKWF